MRGKDPATVGAVGLAAADVDRVAGALCALRRNGLARFALAGGVAAAVHLGAGTGRPRALNDLDLVVPDADAIPASLADGMLVNHLHFRARPGRMLMQIVDPATSLRVDLFGSVGGQMGRAGPGLASLAGARILSRPDLVARLTRLLLDLADGEPVARKHARDHAALSGADLDGIDAAWADHRREHHPADYGEARRRALEVIRSEAGLLVDAPPGFGRPCRLCAEQRGFRIAPEEHIAAVLGRP